MAVKYSLTERGNPLKPEEPKKWYATTKSAGNLTLKQLSKEVAEGSTTVSDTDVLAVLNDLTKIMRRHLANGETVRLGDFGSFQIGIGSSGAESAEKFHHSYIKTKKIAFRPGVDLKELLNTLKFEKQ